MKLRFWYTVWCGSDADLAPDSFSAAIRPYPVGMVSQFDQGQNLNWREAFWERQLADGTSPVLCMSRVLHGEDEFQRRLSVFEGGFKDLPAEPHRELVLAHLHRARQIVDLQPLVSATLGPIAQARICEQLCGYVARTAAGLIQVHEAGFFNVQGESLLPHNPRHSLKTSL